MNLTPEERTRLAPFGVEQTSDGILVFDAEGRILYANPASGRMLSQSPDALQSASLFQIAPELNQPLWKELWKEIRTRGSFAFEFSLAAAGNRTVSVEMTVHQLRIGPKELACAFFRDVAERKRLQNLQQEFVGTVSHELRTPMTVIREGISQVLEGLRGDINEGQRRALSIALAGIERLGRIIDELLDLSKIESGKVALHRERVDVAALAREISASFQGMAQDRKLELPVTTPAGPVPIYADRDRLIQVWTNLISNAFKFTERGSVGITVSARDSEVECSVADTGVGLAAEDVGKIFNKFEQIGNATVTGEKGTGLGLSICRGIVELHKGRIWAESSGPGRGTRLAFVLPRQSGMDVFREEVAGLLQEIAQRGGSLSLVFFDVTSRGRSCLDEREGAAALTGLENLVRQQTGRRTDLLVKDANVVYLALPSTVRREALRVAERVVKVFREGLAREGLESKLEMTYSLHCFPEEAAQEASFLQKVFEREAA